MSDTPDPATAALLDEPLDDPLDDLDPPERWPDDEPVPLDDEVEATELADLPLEPVPDDEAVPLPDLDEAAPDEPALDVVPDTGLEVLPQRTTVTVDGRELPAELDTGRASTVWIRPEADGAPIRADLVLGGHALAATVRTERGEPERLVVGRDLLKDRILVRS